MNRKAVTSDPNQEELVKLQVAQDELRQYIATIEKNELRLAALNAISSLITQSMEIRDVLTLASEKVVEVMDADAILIFLLDEVTDDLVLELYQGISDEFVDGVRRMRIGEGFNGTVASIGEPLVIEDTITNPLLGNDAVVIEGIRSQLIVPLKSKGKAIGTLCVANRSPMKYKEDEVELLSSIGNQIGAGLENARLYQEMKQALRQLSQSEERYRDLFESASDAIWVHDFKGNTLTANKACERAFEYSSDELNSIYICQLLSQESKCIVEEIERKLLHDEPVENLCEVEMVKKGGAIAIVQVTTSLISHEGQPIGFQHAARDVTDEKRMQENLRYYLQQVTRAQEEERKRIARELHDETLQDLIVISRQLEKITSSEALWEESLEVVRGLKKQIESAVQEIRRFSHDMRPSVLDDLGLLPALELLADDLENEGIATTFKVIGEARRLLPEVEVMVFRIAQEAVSNIRRHAKALTSELLLEFTNGVLRVSVKDDGQGFRLPRRTGDLASRGKLGLVGMRERASLLGGTLTLESEPGMGTSVVVEVHV